MEYTRVVSNSMIDFKKAVNQLIEEGWKPQGGISVSIAERPYYTYATSIDCHSRVCYAQAMVKE